MARWLLLGSMTAGLFLGALDMYAIASVVPSLIGDLQIPVDHLERATPILSGFLLGYVGVMPLVAGLSDARGRTAIYAACLVLFAAGSVLTASAQALVPVVAGRAIQGAAGGGLVPITLAVAADLFHGPERLLALAVAAGFQELGSLVGPIYGAWVSHAAAAGLGWRLIFWLNLPLAAGCLIATLLAARSSGQQPAVAPTFRKHGDWQASLLLGAGLAALVVALYPSEPGRSALNALFVPAFVIGLGLLTGFGWRLAKHTSFVSRDLLRSTPFVGGLLTNLLVGGALVAALVEVPLLARTVFSLDELGAAALLAKFMVGLPAGAFIGGFAAGKAGTRPLLALGLLLSAAGFWLMSRWPPDELLHRTAGLPEADLVLAMAGLGFGLVIAPLAASVLSRAGGNEHGVVSSTIVLARMLGMLLGFAVLSSIGLHHFYELVAKAPSITASFGSPDFFRQAQAVQATYYSALLAEYHQIFGLAAAGCAAAAAIGALTGSSAVRPTRTPPSALETARG